MEEEKSVVPKKIFRRDFRSSVLENAHRERNHAQQAARPYNDAESMRNILQQLGNFSSQSALPNPEDIPCSSNQIQLYDQGIAYVPIYNHFESNFVKAVDSKGLNVKTGEKDTSKKKPKNRPTNAEGSQKPETKKDVVSSDSEDEPIENDQQTVNGNTLGRFLREIGGVMIKYADELENFGVQTTSTKKEKIRKKTHDTKDAIDQVLKAIMECNVDEYSKWMKRLVRSIQNDKFHNPNFGCFEKGKEMMKQQNYIEAFVSFRLVSKFNDENLLRGEMEVNFVQHAIGNISEICRHIKVTLVKSSKIVEEIIIPEVKSMIEELKEFKVIDEEDLKHNIVWCYKCLGGMLMNYERYQKALQAMVEGVELMNNTFATAASKKRIYGLTQSEMGDCCLKLKKYDDALEYFKDADASLQASEDWGGDNRKAGVIDQNNRNLTEAEVKAKGSLELDSVLGLLETAADNLSNKNYSEFEKLISTAKVEVEQNASQQLGFQLKSLGQLKYDEEKYFTSFVILSVTSKAFHSVARLTDIAINCIQHAVGCMTQIIEKFSESQEDVDFKRHISTGFIIPAMEDAIKDIEHLDGATMNDRIEHMAWCYKCMGAAYAHLKMNMEAVAALKQGLELMEKHFGSSANEHRIVGLLKGSIGNAYSMDENHKDGTYWYREAAESLQEATDFSSELEKEKVIRISNHNRTASVLKSNETMDVSQTNDYSQLVNLAQSAVIDRDYARFKDHVDALSTFASEAVNPAAYLLNVGVEHDKAGDNLKSFIPFLAIANAYDETKIDKDSLEIISNAIGRIYADVSKVPKDVVKKFVIVKILEILDRLDFLRNTVADELKNAVVLCMTECYSMLGRIYEEVEMSKECMEVCKKAILIMKHTFAEGSYKRYKVLYHVKLFMGKASHNLGQVSEAAKWFEAAERALNSSTDWTQKKEKFEAGKLMESLRGVHNNINQTNSNCNQQ